MRSWDWGSDSSVARDPAIADIDRHIGAVARSARPRPNSASARSRLRYRRPNLDDLSFAVHLPEERGRDDPKAAGPFGNLECGVRPSRHPRPPNPRPVKRPASLRLRRACGNLGRECSGGVHRFVLERAKADPGGGVHPANHIDDSAGERDGPVLHLDDHAGGGMALENSTRVGTPWPRSRNGYPSSAPKFAPASTAASSAAVGAATGPDRRSSVRAWRRE